MKAITDFFARFFEDVREGTDGAGKVGKESFTTCNIQSSWPKRVNDYLFLRGLGQADTECATERVIENEKRSALLENNLPEWAIALNGSAASIASATTNLRSGKNVAGVSRFWYPNRESQNCTLWHTMSLRVNGTWYVQARITADSSSALPTATSDNDYVIEHVTSPDGRNFGVPLLMTRVPVDDNVTIFKQAYATYESWSRPAPDSVGENTDVARNLAFKEALADGENENQQAVDAEQTSNIAILVLPLAMNLVPVALIADVNTLGMLLYTVLTDVLTAVPLCIKGYELITISNKRFSAASAQITGKRDGGPSAVAFGEAWVAQCRLKGHRKQLHMGIGFVTSSVILMIFGMVCEVVARWWVKKRRTHDQNPLSELDAAPQGYGSSYQPFTAAALNLVNRAQPGAQGSGAAAAAVSRGAPDGIETASRTAAAMHHTHSSGIVPAHVHGRNCACACHSAQHGNLGHEYDSRPYPDPLARKYH